MPFARGVGDTGWAKSLYSQDWFDGGSTEFALAGLLDDTDDVAYWLRLQTGDLPLGWAGDEPAYNPDFIVVDKVGIHWVIEGKADDTAKTPDVVAKRDAAIRWAAHVSAITGAAWRVCLCARERHQDGEGVLGSVEETRRGRLTRASHPVNRRTTEVPSAAA
jgi:type III restriction enzyme